MRQHLTLMALGAALYCCTSTAAVPFPHGNILFQPVFVWTDGTESMNGTGFLTTSPDGRVVAVGSAHYVLGGQLPTLAGFLSVKTRDLLFTADLALGPVGDGNPKSPAMGESRACEDYFFLPVPPTLDAQPLELDPRPELPSGEDLWFPNKNFENGIGYEVIDADVVRSSAQEILVRIPSTVKLESQSGTPFVSRETGKVVGTLSAANMRTSMFALRGVWEITLTPAWCLLAALQEHREVMPLLDAAQAEAGTSTRDTDVPDVPSPGN